MFFTYLPSEYYTYIIWVLQGGTALNFPGAKSHVAHYFTCRISLIIRSLDNIPAAPCTLAYEKWSRSRDQPDFLEHAAVPQYKRHW